MSDPAFAALSLDHHSSRRSVLAVLLAEVSAFVSNPRFRVPLILSGLGTLLLCAFLAVFFHSSADVDGFPTSIEEESYLADVVDPFEPRLELSVVFGIRPLLDGVHVSVEEGKEAPNVTLVRLEGEVEGSDSQSLHTLLLVDPDAPDPKQPIARCWLHWLVVDIPMDGKVSDGRAVVPYSGPTPPVGRHRYIFILFRQPGGSIGVDAPPSRRGFNVRSFQEEFSLGPPVAALHFTSQPQ